jgi:hypothetical protein
MVITMFLQLNQRYYLTTIMLNADVLRRIRVVVRISRRLGCGRWPAYASVADPVSYRCAQGNQTGCLRPGAHNDAASGSGLRSCSRKMTASRIEGPLPTPRRPCISKSTGLVTGRALRFYRAYNAVRSPGGAAFSRRARGPGHARRAARARLQDLSRRYLPAGMIGKLNFLIAFPRHDGLPVQYRRG